MQWVYFPLHPDTPQEGILLQDLFAGRGFDLDAMHARMKGLMDAEGLPYERRTHTYNSRLAQELAKWADGQPGSEAIHGALYRAYFVEGRNIGDPDVLVDIAGKVGLPGDAARIVLTERTFKGRCRCGLGKGPSLRHYRRSELRGRTLEGGWRTALRGSGRPVASGGSEGAVIGTL